MAFFVYEFLYRYNGPASGQPPAYHVILAQEIQGLGGTKLDVHHAMTPEQAAAEGHDLPSILSAINTETMSALEATQAALAVARRDLEAAQTERDALRRVVEDAAETKNGDAYHDVIAARSAARAG